MCYLSSWPIVELCRFRYCSIVLNADVVFDGEKNYEWLFGSTQPKLWVSATRVVAACLAHHNTKKKMKKPVGCWRRWRQLLLHYYCYYEFNVLAEAAQDRSFIRTSTTMHGVFELFLFWSGARHHLSVLIFFSNAGKLGSASSMGSAASDDKRGTALPLTYGKTSTRR